MTDQSTLYVITARGGSKGIPHKNIKSLGGKPLILYSVEIARQLAPDSLIAVSTDDPAIADVVRGAGLEVPYMRPAELATDTAGSREVIIDIMDYWRDTLHRPFDKVVLLQPTSPFRTVDDVKGCLELYSPDVDMVLSVMEASCNPYYNCFETGDDGCLHVSKGDGLYTRRQDVPKAWEQNGAVYVINPDSLRRYPLGMMPKRLPFVMPRERSIDLDTPTDWLIAESMINNNTK